MSGHIEIFDDVEAMLDAAATAVVEVAAASIAARGRFTVALSGGSTPVGLHERLAGAWRGRIDWPRVHVFWGDERAVPPDHADSNYGMARRTLLDHVPVPAAQIHRMKGEIDPPTAASDYAATLLTALGDAGHGQPEPLDLALMGLGDDGHTASLFPGRSAGRETERPVVAEHVDAKHGWRITLTPPVLNAARHTIWLVEGAAKAPALAAVLEGPPAPDQFPAQRITGTDVRWMIDREAARRLSS